MGYSAPPMYSLFVNYIQVERNFSNCNPQISSLACGIAKLLRWLNHHITWKSCRFIRKYRSLAWASDETCMENLVRYRASRTLYNWFHQESLAWHDKWISASLHQLGPCPYVLVWSDIDLSHLSRTVFRMGDAKTR